jgi:hypothetical protein
MGRLFTDTSQIVEDELIKRLNLVQPWRKLEMVAQMNSAVREMMLAGLHRQYSEDSPDQRRWRLVHSSFDPDTVHHLQQHQGRTHLMQSSLIEVMTAVADIFDRFEIIYFIGGSMASAYYGVGRSTFDVDFVADIGPEHISPLTDALSHDFYLDEQAIRSAIERRSSFNLIHLATMFKVDVFIPRVRDFDRLQLKRRVAAAIGPEGEQQVYLSTAEDIVLAKLDWYRLGGALSDQQWRDVLGVLLSQKGWLDVAYLRVSASDLGVGDLLERAFVESDYS